MHREKDKIKDRSISHPMRKNTVYLVMGLLAIILCITSLRAKAEDGSEPSSDTPSTSTDSSSASNAENGDSSNISRVAIVKHAQHTAILYKLLVAQLATSRQNKEVAINNAIEAAQMTQDPAIATYATELAIQFQDPEPAIKSAEIWAKNAPKDLQAQMVAATLLISYSIDRAVPYLTQAMILDPNQVNQHLISIQSRLSDRSAENLKMALEQIASKRSQDPFAQLLAAQSTAQQGEISKSNTWVDQALQLKPNLTQAMELKARLIRYEDKSDAKALKYLAEKVQKFPKDAELRMFLASALMDAKQYKEAIAHFTKLTEDKVWGGQAQLFLGEIYLSDNKFQKAKDYLLQAANHKEVADNAMFDLGALSELQHNTADAIKWYTSVNAGPYNTTATLRAVALLKNDQKYADAIRLLHDASPTTFEDQKQLLLIELDILVASKQMEDANNLANTLLEKLPEDVDILLVHSTIASKQKNWKIAENDLKTILEIDPNNTTAAAHLGEVLWVSGQEDEAINVWTNAYKLTPDNQVLLETLDRLNVDIPTIKYKDSERLQKTAPKGASKKPTKSIQQSKERIQGSQT